MWVPFTITQLIWIFLERWMNAWKGGRKTLSSVSLIMVRATFYGTELRSGLGDALIRITYTLHASPEGKRIRQLIMGKSLSHSSK